MLLSQVCHVITFTVMLCNVDCLIYVFFLAATKYTSAVCFVSALRTHVFFSAIAACILTSAGVHGVPVSDSG